MRSEEEIKERIELVKKAIKPYAEFIIDQVTGDLFFIPTRESKEFSKFDLVQSGFYAGFLTALLWVLKKK